MYLKGHTFEPFDHQLDQLMQDILAMGAEVAAMVRAARDCLHAPSPERVEEAVARDKRINALDRKIEEDATKVLALQNPFATDLRFVTSAIKSAGVLERAGDLAKNTVKRSAKLDKPVPQDLLASLEEMANVTAEMLERALDAVRSGDESIAREVWKRDDIVDDLYHDFFTAIQQAMMRDAALIPTCTHLIFMAKNFERIADYATNLAKSVYYVTSGEKPKKSVLKEG